MLSKRPTFANFGCDFESVQRLTVESSALKKSIPIRTKDLE